VAERQCDGVGGVVRLRYGGELTELSDHLHDLALFRQTVSGDLTLVSGLP
jgi:hypothetical protein